MKTLLVLQAREVALEGSTALDDHERPLNEAWPARTGRGWARRCARCGLTPDVIVSSDAVRARLHSRGRGRGRPAPTREIRVEEPRLYAASAGGILAVLRTATGRRTAGTVDGSSGTIPGWKQLVAHLTGEQADLPTAALAQIALPIDRWRDLKGSTRGRLLGPLATKGQYMSLPPSLCTRYSGGRLLSFAGPSSVNRATATGLKAACIGQRHDVVCMLHSV